MAQGIPKRNAAFPKQCLCIEQCLFTASVKAWVSAGFSLFLSLSLFFFSFSFFLSLFCGVLIAQARRKKNFSRSRGATQNVWAGEVLDGGAFSPLWGAGFRQSGNAQSLPKGSNPSKIGKDYFSQLNKQGHSQQLLVPRFSCRLSDASSWGQSQSPFFAATDCLRCSLAERRGDFVKFYGEPEPRDRLGAPHLLPFSQSCFKVAISARAKFQAHSGA